MHYTYILISQNSPDKIYIGSTSDLDQRLKKHNKGDSTYSKRYAPWNIETFVCFSSRKRALEFEQYLKSGSGFAFLKKRLLP